MAPSVLRLEGGLSVSNRNSKNSSLFTLTRTMPRNAQGVGRECIVEQLERGQQKDKSCANVPFTDLLPQVG